MIVFLTYKIFFTIQQKEIISNKINSIPILYLNSIQIHSNQLKNKTIFNYFSPNCEHCQYMSKSIFKNKDSFKNISLIMITKADKQSILEFKKEFLIDSLPFVILIKDSNENFYNHFASSMVPSYYIYKNNVLIKKILGETKIENLFTD